MTKSSENLHADGSELTKNIWLTLPLLLTAIVLAAYLSLKYRTYVYWFEREIGFIELATPTILIFAIFYGVRVFQLRNQLPVWWLKIWMVLVTLGCVYFAGEDLSWGQHIIGWDTPEEIKAINDQQETNIHNISSWFDQKPRLLLELWIIIGGIFIAGWRKWKGEIFEKDAWQYWFWPGFACFPAAVLAELAKSPERIKTTFDLPSLPFGEVRYSELQELMFAVFLLCYLASVFKRLKMIKNET